MELVKWSSRFDVGIETINNEHKQIILLINNLYTAMKEGNSKTILAKSIEDMVGYYTMHFKTEEAMLAKYHYPEADEHIARHKEFISKTNELLNHTSTSSHVVSIDTLHYLRIWITDHILQEDQAYAEFIQKAMNPNK